MKGRWFWRIFNRRSAIKKELREKASHRIPLIWLSALHGKIQATNRLKPLISLFPSASLCKELWVNTEGGLGSPRRGLLRHEGLILRRGIQRNTNGQVVREDHPPCPPRTLSSFGFRMGKRWHFPCDLRLENSGGDGIHPGMRRADASLTDVPLARLKNSRLRSYSLFTYHAA